MNKKILSALCLTVFAMGIGAAQAGSSALSCTGQCWAKYQGCGTKCVTQFEDCIESCES